MAPLRSGSPFPDPKNSSAFSLIESLISSRTTPIILGITGAGVAGKNAGATVYAITGIPGADLNKADMQFPNVNELLHFLKRSITSTP